MIEKGPAAGRQHLGDGAGDRGTKTGKRFKRVATAFRGDRREINVQCAYRVGGPAVSSNAEWDRPLRREDVSSLVQLVGHLDVRLITTLSGIREGARLKRGRPSVQSRLTEALAHFASPIRRAGIRRSGPAAVKRIGPHAKYGMIWINALRPPEPLIEIVCDYCEV